METKPLLFGLIGFFIGGLVVSTAATTFEKPEPSISKMSMSHTAESLSEKRGENFDKAFIEAMIMHHQGAVDMARLAETNAKHNEVKELSKAIITAQNKEIETMQRWQSEWGYETSASNKDMAH